jgi:predicted RNA-binding protein associated with RNAse of E/G family
MRRSTPAGTMPPDPAYAPGDTVRIHYTRPPDRVQLFEQAVVHDAGLFVVTFLAAAQVKKPVTVEGRVVLEPGAPVVWFTYRGDVWHDVGRFHLADGTFTGVYANVLTPVQMEGTRWDTTDLYLDVWRGADGEIQLLDREEFDEAVGAGLLTPAVAERAFTEGERLVQGARQGAWPPAHVEEWTLERVRTQLR